MRRADWTPVVLITSSFALTAVVVVIATTPILMGVFPSEPGPTLERRRLATEVSVWVGEIAPGISAVLSPVWGEPGPDAAHDRRLNEELELPEGWALAWSHLILFNTTGEDQTVNLSDGALLIQSETGAEPTALRSLAPLVARGEASLSPGLLAVLGVRGSLAEAVTVPAGWMADLLVPFERRVALDDAVEVASATGAVFRRRPMERRELEALVEDPTDEAIEDL